MQYRLTLSSLFVLSTSDNKYGEDAFVSWITILPSEKARLQIQLTASSWQTAFWPIKGNKISVLHFSILKW